MNFHFDVPQAILLFLIMYLFNLLTFVRQPVKDIVNTVVIILIFIFVFYLGTR